MTSNTCTRTARNPWRRKKNCLFIAIPVVAIVAFIQMIEMNGVYSPLRPLSDAKGEARRLLKIMTHYNYQCNQTASISNSSQWPICVDKDIGLNLDNKDKKILYTVGSNIDFNLERSLAHNHSFEVFIASQTDVPSMQHLNNTHVISTVIVANDPADYSRNLYNQRTVNDLMSSLSHSHIDLLRLVAVDSSVQMWELLRFLIHDNVLLNVDMLHLAVYIDKVDEDHLYNWYRALYQLFSNSAMYLYHTSSQDSLCLQVTLMESCVYYLSFIHIAHPTVLILYPPADYGTIEQEEHRLLDHINTIQVDCKQRTLGTSSISAIALEFQHRPQWQICLKQFHQSAKRNCNVLRFRSSSDDIIEKELISDNCNVYTVSHADKIADMYQIKNHIADTSKIVSSPRPISSSQVVQLLNDLGQISLVEVDMPGLEWNILTLLQNNAILHNVTQLVMRVSIGDQIFGVHPTLLRTRYSQLRRIESNGFLLFYSTPYSPCTILPSTGTLENWCFTLGYIRKEFL